MVLEVPPGLERYLNILAEEAGISCNDLENDTEFSDLGIDRTLARVVTERIAQVTNLRLSVDLFEEFPDVKSFVGYLEKHTQRGDHDCKAANPTPASNGHKSQVAERGMARIAMEKMQSKVPLIMLLKGNPTPASRNVFLMPDGSGSAMSYARIPNLGTDWVLYGLNSPYLGAGPSQLSIPRLASLWVDEIMATQPHGPYILGGWSAGGYYSTEVARLLLQRGESIESLIIIDSPCRLQYGAPPIQLFQFLADKNLMGDFPKGAPTWLMDHFAATMAAVETYHPAPVLGVGRVYIIEAHAGVLNSEQEAAGSGLDLSIGVTKMLLLRRGTESVNGWERQFPGAQLRCSRTSGNHFTLVHPPHVDMLGSLLREAIEGDADRLDNWSLWARNHK
jgi:thioesterase domain-containing protein